MAWVYGVVLRMDRQKCVSGSVTTFAFSKAAISAAVRASMEISFRWMGWAASLSSQPCHSSIFSVFFSCSFRYEISPSARSAVKYHWIWAQ